jgi:hypothetical protein
MSNRQKQTSVDYRLDAAGSYDFHLDLALVRRAIAPGNPAAGAPLGR